MISKCQIQKYICQIENDIGGDVYSNYNIRTQYFGMLYGIKIAKGIKKYPIECDGIEITDEYKKGLLKGLNRVLWCITKIEDEYVDECISHYVNNFKNILDCIVTDDKNSMLINVKFELDKAAYKKFIADMKEIEAYMKLDNNINVAGEYLEYGDVVHKKSDGKFYKSDVSENTMSPERNAEITAELERQIRTGELNPKSIGHIPAKLKDVCEWWIKTYPEDVFFVAPVQVIEIRDNMKIILESMK